MSPGVGSSFFVDKLMRPLSLSWLRIMTCTQQTKNSEFLSFLKVTSPGDILLKQQHSIPTNYRSNSTPKEGSPKTWSPKVISNGYQTWNLWNWSWTFEGNTDVVLLVPPYFFASLYHNFKVYWITSFCTSLSSTMGMTEDITLSLSPTVRTVSTVVRRSWLIWLMCRRPLTPPMSMKAP